MMRKSGRRRTRRLRGHGALRLLGWGVLLTAALVGLLRFVPPPVTAFMLWARGSAAWESRPFALDFRWRPLGEISPEAARAVLAAEDQRFLEHHGFDFHAIGNALSAHARGGRLRGGSTITQQTAKNLFLWPGRTWLRKAAEAYGTILIEILWPKRRTLEMYLNIVEFGDGIYGIEAASRKFFGKPASRLDRREAALLAGVLPQPRRLHADRPSGYLRRRAEWIARQMAGIRLDGVYDGTRRERGGALQRSD